MPTITWRGTTTAMSSIAHGGETRGTITLLRRELILTPDGATAYVPIISGNGFRGLLRRTGEELLRETLNYEGHLSLAAAHALRAGGSLAKTGKEPLSGSRLANLRNLIPHIGVFGCAGGGRIIDGCLQVGKVIPHLQETRHLIHPAPTGQLLPAFDATQIETYVRQDDGDTHAFAPLTSPVDPSTGELTPTAQAAAQPPTTPGADTSTGTPNDSVVGDPAAASMLMMYRLETFPAGTRFTTWLNLNHATDLEAAFFTDVLETYSRTARLGGRAAIGHGDIHLDLDRTPTQDPRDTVDWRAHLTNNKDAALTALQELA